MSAEKTLDKILRGDSDTNIRFEEICHLLQAKGFRMRVNGSHHIFTQNRRDGAHQSSARRREGQAISGSTSP
jgi:hypothetical protein